MNVAILVFQHILFIQKALILLVKILLIVQNVSIMLGKKLLILQYVAILLVQNIFYCSNYCNNWFSLVQESLIISFIQVFISIIAFKELSNAHYQ